LLNYVLHSKKEKKKGEKINILLYSRFLMNYKKIKTYSKRGNLSGQLPRQLVHTGSG